MVYHARIGEGDEGNRDLLGTVPDCSREDVIEGGSATLRTGGVHPARQCEGRVPDEGVSVAKPRPEGPDGGALKRVARGAKRKKKSSGGDRGPKKPVTGPLKPVIPFEMLEDGTCRALPPLEDELLRPAVAESQDWPNV